MKRAKISDIVNQNMQFFSENIDFRKDFFGDAPAPFIGRYNYPNINVGVLSAVNPESKELLDSPKQWSAKNVPLRSIVQARSSLMNSRFPSTIKPKQDKLNQLAQEVGLAAKSVEVELHVKDKPRFRLQTHQHAAPHGPNAELVKGKVTSNPHIPTKVQKAFDDPHLKSAAALTSLYNKGADENHLSQVLSVGALGIAKNRKLVPTRWSITATDDTLGKALWKEVRELPVRDSYALYQNKYLGNHYFVLLFPEVWSYELFETATFALNSYSTDYENFYGRKTYAESTTGGYYTVKLAVLEKMKEKRKQGAALVVRFVTPEYEAPLGVWVTREATRKAMQSKPLLFNTKESLLKEVKEQIREKFRFDLSKFLARSILYKELSSQTKLFSFTTKY